MKTLSCFTLLFLAALCIALPVCAQTASSTSKDVYFAFFKTGGKTPDFSRALKASPAYRKVPVTKQKQFLLEEHNRLMTAFKAYDPAIDFLRVQTPVTATLAMQPREGQDPLYTLNLAFKKGDATFFPYSYEAYDIAVLPQKLPELMTQPIHEAQFELIRSTFKGRLQGPAVLFVEMKPTKSYMNQPYEIDGKDQWALITDVAGMILASESGSPLWSYNAPWYVSDTTDELNTMFSDENKRKKDEMRSENPIAPGQ